MALLLVGCSEQAGSGPPAPAGKAAPAADSKDEQLVLAPFQRSALTMVGTSAGKPNASTFERLTGRLTLHDGQPRTLEFSVEASSVVSSSGKLAARLKDKEFFDAGAHARVEFRASELRPTPSDKSASGGPTHLLVGELLLLGKTLPVSFPARLEIQSDAVTITAQSVLGRPAWSKAFSSQPDDLFQERLEVVSKLVFPRAPALLAK